MTTIPDAAWSALDRLVIIALCAFLNNLVVPIRVGLTRVHRPRSLLGKLRIDRPSLIQEVVDLPGVLGYSVGYECQRRGKFQTELLADLGANEASRRSQRSCCGRLLLTGAQHRIEHRGVTTVTGEPYIGHRHKAEPRIFDPPLQHLGNNHLDLVSQLQHAWRAHLILPHAYLSEPS